MIEVKEKLMNIEPLENRVVVKPLEEEVSSTGIIIPTDAKEKSMEGIIVAVGPGIITLDGTLVKMRLKKDDIVLYSKFVGTEVTYQGSEYLIMKESEVLAILNREKNDGRNK